MVLIYVRRWNSTCFWTVSYTLKVGTVQRRLTGVEIGTNGLIILNCLVGHFPFLILKGHHHERSIKQSPASSQLLLQSSVSPSSCCTVPRCPRIATVRRATLPYIFLCWLAPIGGDNHQCTATVRCWRCTIQGLYRFMMMKFAPVPNFKIVFMLIQIIVKDQLDQSRPIQLLWRRWWRFMLLLWWCPFKIK